VFSFFKWGKSPLEKENTHLESLLSSLKIKTNKPELYLQALRHKSVYESSFQNNERLEFLGDSILDSVVAEVLYEKFPQGKEGFLTQIRSRIVSRSNLNRLGISLQLDKLIEVQMGREIRETSLSGNALEALIGAIYLDKGFIATNKFIREQLIAPHINFNTILTQEPDPKSRVIERAQKNKVKVLFLTSIFQKEEPQSFVSKVIFDGEEIASATGASKKKAEQKAAAEALNKLID
jgi:ribonuclease-3